MGETGPDTRDKTGPKGQVVKTNWPEGQAIIFSGTKDTTFNVGVFPMLEPAYWLLRNKQPIGIGGQISPSNQPIGIVSFLTEKILVYDR